MPRVSGSYVPQLQCWGKTRKARVKLNGIHVYLGDFDDEGARQRYDETIAIWMANGRRWPPPLAAAMNLEELCDLYTSWCRTYYVKGDRQTNTGKNAARAVELLYQAGLVKGLATSFGPAQVVEFQLYLCRHPQQRFCRQTINEYVRYIAAMFEWAAGRGLFQGMVFRWEDLKAVPELRKGRHPAPGVPIPREGTKVEPVDDETLATTLKHCRPMLAAMINLQLLTAMRPTEVVHMRAGDLQPTIIPGVIAYYVRAEGNKLDHFDIERTVYVGPKGMEILRPWLPEDPEAYVFSPKRAREDFDASRRAARSLPRWPSHSPQARAARRQASPERRPPRDHYDTDSYRRAIHRACDQAFPHPTLTEQTATSEAQLKELEAWYSKHRWSPNQLRHNAATHITEQESLEVAQLVLGHADISTTMKYVKVRDRRAVLAALKLG